MQRKEKKKDASKDKGKRQKGDKSKRKMPLLLGAAEANGDDDDDNSELVTAKLGGKSSKSRTKGKLSLGAADDNENIAYESLWTPSNKRSCATSEPKIPGGLTWDEIVGLPTKKTSPPASTLTATEPATSTFTATTTSNGNKTTLTLKRSALVDDDNEGDDDSLAELQITVVKHKDVVPVADSPVVVRQKSSGKGLNS